MATLFQPSTESNQSDNKLLKLKNRASKLVEGIHSRLDDIKGQLDEWKQEVDYFFYSHKSIRKAVKVSSAVAMATVLTLALGGGEAQADEDDPPLSSEEQEWMDVLSNSPALDLENPATWNQGLQNRFRMLMLLNLQNHESIETNILGSQGINIDELRSLINYLLENNIDPASLSFYDQDAVNNYVGQFGQSASLDLGLPWETPGSNDPNSLNTRLENWSLYLCQQLFGNNSSTEMLNAAHDLAVLLVAPQVYNQVVERYRNLQSAEFFSPQSYLEGRLSSEDQELAAESMRDLDVYFEEAAVVTNEEESTPESDVETTSSNELLRGLENMQLVGNFSPDYPALPLSIIELTLEQINSLYADVSSDDSPKYIFHTNYERSVGLLLRQISSETGTTEYEVVYEFPVGLATPANREDNTNYTDFTFSYIEEVITDIDWDSQYGDLLMRVAGTPEEIHDGTQGQSNRLIQLQNNSNGCPTLDQATVEVFRNITDLVSSRTQVIVVPNSNVDILEFFEVSSLSLNLTEFKSSARYYLDNQYPTPAGRLQQEEQEYLNYLETGHPEIERTGAVRVNYEPFLNNYEAVVTVNIYDGTLTVWRIENGSQTEIYTARVMVGERLVRNQDIADQYNNSTYANDGSIYENTGVLVDANGVPRHTLTPPMMANYYGLVNGAGFGRLPVTTQYAALRAITTDISGESDLYSEYTFHIIPPVDNDHYNTRRELVDGANSLTSPTPYDPYWSHGCINVGPGQWSDLTSILEDIRANGGNIGVIFSYPDMDQSTLVRESGFNGRNDPLFSENIENWGNYNHQQEGASGFSLYPTTNYLGENSQEYSPYIEIAYIPGETLITETETSTDSETTVSGPLLGTEENPVAPVAADMVTNSTETEEETTTSTIDQPITTEIVDEGTEIFTVSDLGLESDLIMYYENLTITEKAELIEDMLNVIISQGLMENDDFSSLFFAADAEAAQAFQDRLDQEGGADLLISEISTYMRTVALTGEESPEIVQFLLFINDLLKNPHVWAAFASQVFFADQTVPEGSVVFQTDTGLRFEPPAAESRGKAIADNESNKERIQDKSETLFETTGNMERDIETYWRTVPEDSREREIVVRALLQDLINIMFEPLIAPSEDEKDKKKLASQKRVFRRKLQSQAEVLNFLNQNIFWRNMLPLLREPDQRRQALAALDRYLNGEPIASGDDQYNQLFQTAESLIENTGLSTFSYFANRIWFGGLVGVPLPKGIKMQKTKSGRWKMVIPESVRQSTRPVPVNLISNPNPAPFADNSLVSI